MIIPEPNSLARAMDFNAEHKLWGPNNAAEREAIPEPPCWELGERIYPKDSVGELFVEEERKVLCTKYQLLQTVKTPKSK